MNYYNRYPAHYLAKTLLLSLEQDGAYTRLMDWYYAEERGIPNDKRYTVGRCQSKRERDAVDMVLREFFELVDGVWLHQRIERELAKAAPKVDAARENGKKGGRPRIKKPNGFPEKNPLGFSEETQKEPSAKAPQTPNPNISVGSSSTHPEDLEGLEHPGSGVCQEPTPEAKAAIALRKLGCRVTPQNPDLRAAIAEGITLSALVAMAETYPGKPAGYVISACRRQHAETASPVATARAGPNGKPPIAQQFANKTYEGTPDDQLPAHLRSDAAQFASP